jgi:hypothetical protein
VHDVGAHDHAKHSYFAAFAALAGTRRQLQLGFCASALVERD